MKVYKCKREIEFLPYFFYFKYDESGHLGNKNEKIYSWSKESIKI